MSLEARIAENTAALQALTAALLAMAGQDAGKFEAAEKPNKKAAAAQVEKPAATPATAAAPGAAQETKAENSGVALDFDKDIVPAFTAAVKVQGGAFAAACCQHFKVQRISQLPPAAWPELLAYVANATAAVA